MNMAEVTKKLADLKQTQSYEKTFDFTRSFVAEAGKANTFAKMYDYYLNGVGQNEILGTAWGAYNAVTGYYSNVVEMEPRKRMDSLTWGTANRAMNIALDRAYNLLEAA